MRVLLDEHPNWRLTREFSETHRVRSVRGMGWAGKENGSLLSAAEVEFDVLVTMNRNREHQQNLSAHGLAVVLLVGPSNRLEDTVAFVPQLERGVEAGRLYRVEESG